MLTLTSMSEVILMMNLMVAIIEMMFIVTYAVVVIIIREVINFGGNYGDGDCVGRC